MPAPPGCGDRRGCGSRTLRPVPARAGSTQQPSSANSQRGTNGQPAGMFIMLGGLPGMVSSAAVSWSSRGTALSRPSV